MREVHPLLVKRVCTSFSNSIFHWSSTCFVCIKMCRHWISLLGGWLTNQSTWRSCQDVAWVQGKLSEKYVSAIVFFQNSTDFCSICELTKGELWQVNKTLFATVRCVICKWLRHQMCFHIGSSQAFFHELHRFNTGHWVKMAINPNNRGTYE